MIISVISTVAVRSTSNGNSKFIEILKHFEGIISASPFCLIEVRECLLPFGAESFVFQVAIQKLKDQDI
jgi:hypothetical protein